MCKVYSTIYIGVIIGFMLFTPVSLFAQKDNPFRALARENQNRQLRRTFLASDTISLEGMGTIYSFSIDATIHQPREASFTRIVLEDTEGHDYLVAESDWFRNDTTEVHLDHFCEETVLLDGITPLRLKCYLAEDASLTLTGIHTSNQRLIQKNSVQEKSSANIKEAQVQNIVDRINEYNRKHQKHWRAKITDRAIGTYENRSHRLNPMDDAYTHNTLYYGSGIYEFGSPAHSVGDTRSQYPDTVDWRNRHGKNWITPCRNQGASGWCTVFAAVALTEAYANLYYNRILNWDLSEEYLAKSLHLKFDKGTLPSIAFQKIAFSGIIDEETLPFLNDSNQVVPDPLPAGNMWVKTPSHSEYSLRNGINGLKRILIKNGPVLSGFNAGGLYHAVLCVGYGKITPNSIYYIIHNQSTPNEEVPILAGDSLIGKDCWYFKDNYAGESDHGHDGYMYAVFHDYNYMNNAYYLSGILKSSQYDYKDVVCEDKDHDGYFFWGIFPNGKFNHLPSWAPTAEDGDDSDYTKGRRLDDYGTLEELSLDNDTLYILTNDSISAETYTRKHVSVRSTGSLYLSANLFCYPGARLTLECGAVLEIDGGTLHNIILDAHPGSSIIIKNGGKIIGRKDYGHISIPVGVNLLIQEGDIYLEE